jgi:Tfp pilus assembly protein PilO
MITFLSILVVCLLIVGVLLARIANQLSRELDDAVQKVAKRDREILELRATLDMTADCALSLGHAHLAGVRSQLSALNSQLPTQEAKP